MYYLIKDTTYNDSLLCDGYESRSMEEDLPEQEMVNVSRQNFFFEIYPNPASDYVFISYDLNSPGRLTLFNASGQIVFIAPLAEGSVTQQRLPIDQIPNGVYFYKITSESRPVRSGRLSIIR